MEWYRFLATGLAAVIIVLLVGAAGAVASTVGTPRATTAPPGPAPLAASVKVHYTIPTGDMPDGGTLDTANGNVFVSNKLSDNVTVISASTHDHSTISVGTTPSYVVYNPDDQEVYVLNEGSGNVSIIDGATDAIAKTVSLGAGSEPVAGYFDPADGSVLVLNNDTSAKTNAWLIANETATLTKLSLDLSLSYDAVYSPASHDFYVADYLGGIVSAISDKGKITKFVLNGPPSALAYAPASGDIVVAIDEILPSTPAELATISSANKLSSPTSLPSEIGGFAFYPGTYDPFNTQVYFISYNLTLNASFAVVATAAGAYHGAVALGGGTGFFPGFLNAANQDLYFGQIERTGVVVVDNDSAIVTTITTTQSVTVLIYDPSTKSMFGAGDNYEAESTTVSLLYSFSSTNKATDVKVGKTAVAFVYDPVDQYVYVVNLYSNTVSLAS